MHSDVAKNISGEATPIFDEVAASVSSSHREAAHPSTELKSALASAAGEASEGVRGDPAVASTAEIGRGA
ncbi:hypothetical protein [Amycolatopsis methanolica]|uniref:hypothetical protein n=1 Tax=Amycolatopsis methanolica TaxID=1814 RepID=UPI00344AC627